MHKFAPSRLDVEACFLASAVALGSCSDLRNCDAGEGARKGARAALGSAAHAGQGAVIAIGVLPVYAGAAALYCEVGQLGPPRVKWRMSDTVIADLERRAAAGDATARATLDSYREPRQGQQ